MQCDITHVVGRKDGGQVDCVVVAAMKDPNNSIPTTRVKGGRPIQLVATGY